jgi:hypothetical protein
VPASAVVEALDEREDREPRLVAGAERVPSSSSVSSVAKKLSATALSKASPRRPMLGSTPACSIVLPKARLVYCEPRSE